VKTHDDIRRMELSLNVGFDVKCGNRQAYNGGDGSRVFIVGHDRSYKNGLRMGL